MSFILCQYFVFYKIYFAIMDDLSTKYVSGFWRWDQRIKSTVYYG